MKHLNAVFLSSLIALTATAQVRQPESGGALAGTVTDAATGQPIRSASVVLRNEAESTRPSQSATDENGKFAFRNIAPGRYRLYATKNGYLRQEYGAKYPDHAGALIEIQSNENLPTIALAMTAQAVISGRVVDAEGEPLAGVNVQAMRRGFANGRPQLAIAKGALTNDLGEYRIFGLGPGRYYVSAVASDLPSGASPIPASPPGTDEDGYVPVFYPGATEVSSATEISLSGGRTYQAVDFRLRRMRTVSIGGVVQSSVAVCSRRIIVRLMPKNSGMFGIVAGKFTSQFGPKGEFELTHVPPGSYVLSAECFAGNNRYSARQLIEVGSATPENVRLVIGLGSDVAGHFTLEGVKPANLSAVRIRLTPSDSTTFEGKEDAVQLDGSFVVPHIPADTYALEVRNLPEGIYVKSATLFDRDVLASGLVVQDSGFSGKLEIVGSRNGAKVDGSVLTEEQKPAAGAVVIVIPDVDSIPRADLIRQVTTDQNGIFHVIGVAPGKYRAFAVEGGADPGIFMDAGFRRRIEDSGEPFQVKERELVTIRVALLPEAKVQAIP